MHLGEAPEVALASEAGHWARMARVMISGSLSRAGRPVFGCSEAWSSFHQSSTSTYNETKKESRSIATSSFGESLVKHTVWTPSALLRVTHQPSKNTHPLTWSNAPKMPITPVRFLIAAGNRLNKPKTGP